MLVRAQILTGMLSAERGDPRPRDLLIGRSTVRTRRCAALSARFCWPWMQVRSPSLRQLIWSLTLLTFIAVTSGC